MLKEYISRGNYIYPPEPTMRLTTDIFAYCDENVPKWNTISISGYHIREKGCSAVQEVAFTLANAIAYVEGGIAAGLDVNKFGQRLAFFFNGHNNVFQEIAKFRAVRRMWAKLMKERFGATEEKAQMIRFHTQTGGVTLQAQQPEVNIIRVALQGFAAVAGGTQSLHTNGFDEALALPTERSARIALRTQQVLAHESGVADTVDPFAGSYFIESLTDEIEERSWELMDKVEQLGGSVNALEFMQREIEESAASYHERYRTGQDIIVGVNKYETDVVDDVEILKVDPESEKRQLERLAKWKAGAKPGRGRRPSGRAAQGRRGRGEPAASDQGGAARRRLDRRGLQRDARRLRRVPRRRVLLALLALLAALLFFFAAVPAMPRRFFAFLHRFPAGVDGLGPAPGPGLAGGSGNSDSKAPLSQTVPAGCGRATPRWSSAAQGLVARATAGLSANGAWVRLAVSKAASRASTPVASEGAAV